MQGKTEDVGRTESVLSARVHKAVRGHIYSFVRQIVRATVFLLDIKQAGNTARAVIV